MEGLLILAALCVAFSNGANDNFKVDHPCLGRSDCRGRGGSQDHRLGDGARHRFVMGRHLAVAAVLALVAALILRVLRA